MFLSSQSFSSLPFSNKKFKKAVLYYSGAASTAGQSYTGAVFVTRDGTWPDPKHFQRVEEAHEKCGIKLWELFEVENYFCSDAPLDPLLEAA